MRARILSLAAALAQMVACGATGPRVELARVPDQGVQPQVAVDAAGTLHLVYLSGDPLACDVWYRRRVVGQADFGERLRVNSVPGSAIAVGTVRGAQIALGRNGWIHVVWNGSDRASTRPGAGSPFLYTRLNAAGTEAEPQRNLMTLTTHLDGGGSVAADNEGRVYAVWHGHRKTGPQEEIDRAVFVALSSDDGKTFGAEQQVNPSGTGVCGCCGLKAFADDKGVLAILFRSASPDGNRDSELLLSTDHAKTFSTEVLGRWHVSTCPMSTHDLGPSTSGIGCAWEKEGKVYFATVGPSAGAVGTAISPASAKPDSKHAVFAVNRADKSVLLAWTEGTGWEKGGNLAWECFGANGETIGSGRHEGVPVWGAVAAVAEPNGLFAVFY